MTATVDHTRDHELAVAGRQAACGWALHHLATEKTHTGDPLPALVWTIRDDQPRLAGIAYLGTSQERVNAVHQWAAHLNTTATEAVRDGARVIEMDAIAYSVDVHIWARLPHAGRKAA